MSSREQIGVPRVWSVQRHPSNHPAVLQSSFGDVLAVYTFFAEHLVTEIISSRFNQFSTVGNELNIIIHDLLLIMLL